MLDTAGILFSTIMLLIVVIQAARLDRVLPWFQAVAPKDPSGPASRTWERQR